MVRAIGPFDGWRAWGKPHGVEVRPPHYVMETDSYHAAALAVSRGEGICLGILPFIRPWISAGKIEIVDSFRTRIHDTACLVYAPHNRHHPAITRLQGWLTAFLT